MREKLLRDFYDRDTAEVAKDLLGKRLVRVRNGTEQVGRIVEVEAYLGEYDLACHSSRGRTARTAVMFGPPGFAYVYMIYGMHYCLNVVTEPQGNAAAVLIRALEPIQNIDEPTNGPARLCKTLQIDRRLNGHDLLSDDFFIAAPELPQRFSVVARPRVGVAYAGEWADRPLRYYIKGNPFVSQK
jgi:DNA-3-methyladenine glycosylase